MLGSENMHVGLLNDSFPPRVDGVAQTVKNYAQALTKKEDCDVTVITPKDKNMADEMYPFPIYRYMSFHLPNRLEYQAGNPFSPTALHDLQERNMDLLHVHCPFASAVLAKNLNLIKKHPTIITYHTKFDIDIKNRLALPAMQKAAIDVVRKSLEDADEVWAVTKSCGNALRDIGYEGDFIVMENGTDFALGKAPQERVDELRIRYHIPDDNLVFLFVGRMMWYKNLKLILDSLKVLRNEGVKFTCLLAGDGLDLEDIRNYAHENGLDGCTRFTGMLRDREELRVFYTLADLFLFPSTYDTSGIVVKEASAVECPSLLISGSAAAEGVIDEFNGFLAEENIASCSSAIMRACEDPIKLHGVGRNASETLYLSWEDAVDRAYKRYQYVLNHWKG